MRKYKTLEVWIREALADGDKDGGCTALSVVYKADGKTKEIHTVKLQGKTWEPKTLSELFQGKCETFAQDLGGIQRFELLAFYSNRNEPEATHPFTIIDGEMQAGGAARNVKEDATQSGLLAQLMRHLERKDDTTVALVQGFAATTLERERALIANEQSLRTEVNDAYALVRELIMMRKQDDHKMVMEQMRFQRETKDRELLFTKGPALINTIAEKEVFPQNTADTALIESIAESVKEEHLDMLEKMKILPAEIVGPLRIRFQQVAEKKALEDKKAAELPPAKGETLQ